MSAFLTRDPAQHASAAPIPGALYEAFGNVEARNDLQALIEIPLMIRGLGLAPAARILEVGCGRGIALPVLHERLHPDHIVGVAGLWLLRERIHSQTTQRRARGRSAATRALDCVHDR